MTSSQLPPRRSSKPHRTVSIIGTGSYAPARVLTNYELEKMVDTTDAWIRTRTGISERRIAAEGENTSDMAVQAARAAMEQAEVHPEEIDLSLSLPLLRIHSFPLPPVGCKRNWVHLMPPALTYLLLVLGTYIRWRLPSNLSLHT